MRLRYKVIIISITLLGMWGCGREKITEPIDESIPAETPSDLNVYAAFDGQIGLEWTNNNEPNVKGYFIYRSINQPSHFMQRAFTSNNYFMDDSLFYDSTYYYKVSAVNNLGIESPLTQPVSGIPKNFYAPLTPSYLNINARNWTNSVGINLYWTPPLDHDIKGYEIYRSETPGFAADSIHFLNFTSDLFYFDSKQMKLLTAYYYKIIAVDKGNLKSPVTPEVSDIILDSPQLVYPAYNAIITSLSEFHIKTVSKAARYKLVIQANEIYGTVGEINFSTDKTNEQIIINVTNLQLEPYRTYKWRVYTYTTSDIDPNSYSPFFTFTYNP
ncbi:MAG: hypothetical protein NTX65_16935 [Ignavibacteriales bacterium]|nr:hypothetical protein [Ignavibacteriales bacterium]